MKALRSYLQGGMKRRTPLALVPVVLEERPDRGRSTSALQTSTGRVTKTSVALSQHRSTGWLV